MTPTTTLTQLQPQESGIVKKLPQDPSLSLRLREMGLLLETKITLIRVAPLGDPFEFRVRGYHLSLRKEEASQIFIEKISSLT